MDRLKSSQSVCTSTLEHSNFGGGLKSFVLLRTGVCSHFSGLVGIAALGDLTVARYLGLKVTAARNVASWVELVESLN